MHSGRFSRVCVGSLCSHSPLLKPTAQACAAVFLHGNDATGSAGALFKAQALLQAEGAALQVLRCC